jgi:uncharacterized phiE125 gp8 family phage protein
MRFSLSPVGPVDGEQILPLAFAKAHLRVLHDAEDELISGFRDSALDAVEQFTGRSLSVARSYIWNGCFGDDMILGVMPRAVITTVKYVDVNGVDQILPPNQFLIRIGNQNQLMPPVGKNWPVTADGDGVVEIAFTAGYAVGACPPSLLQAARLTPGMFYANREAVTVGVSASELPLGFARLCQPYRSMRV